jgi:hypothetical protein
MSFSPSEPKIGILFAGIALAIFVPALSDLNHGKEGFERAFAIAGAIGALGTFFGVIDASGNGPSLWPHGIWCLLGIGFGGLVVSGALASHSPWWQMGLAVLALAQLVAMTGPILAGIRRRDRDGNA